MEESKQEEKEVQESAQLKPLKGDDYEDDDEQLWLEERVRRIDLMLATANTQQATAVTCWRSQLRKMK